MTQHVDNDRLMTQHVDIDRLMTQHVDIVIQHDTTCRHH